ncbi:MAG TPA: TolC family protein [Chitinophagaceae bacterium]|nr:TolC family protein [Chitinophagaceae bacterium]
MVKFTAWLLGGILWLGPAAAQPTQHLTLDQVWDLARKNYPAIHRKDLVSQTASLTMANLQKAFLPQVNLSGQATYQSDVTKISVALPGFHLDPLSRDQYKLVTDVSQLVYDGGQTRQQKAAQQLNAAVEDNQVDVELYQLRDRITQIYLSILLLDEERRQVDLVRQDIQTGIDQVQAQVASGVAYHSDLNTLKAELLKTDQRATEVTASRNGLLQALALFLNRDLGDSTVLEIPAPAGTVFSDSVLQRPELKLYASQSEYLHQQDRLLRARNLPRASLFVQGGYGRPGLNLLQNAFAFYYIGGVRLNWSLAGLYTLRKDRELVEVNRRLVDLQRSTFLLNTSTQLRQQQAEIEKWQALVASDDTIVALRASVKEAARARLENGVMTANDYLREVNAEDQARQARITHTLELLQACIEYQLLQGRP